MEVVFLGTGTSQGVPMIACDCAVCTSPDPRNRRTRSSIHVTMGDLHVQVDATPEFRLQCVRENIRQLDVFILTHGHADHITGMDDLRRFCDLIGGEALTVYTTDEGMARVLSISLTQSRSGRFRRATLPFGSSRCRRRWSFLKARFAPHCYRTAV